MTLKKKLTNIREATPMYHKFGLGQEDYVRRL